MIQPVAERVGFEPTVGCPITSFQDWLLKPLGHLSMWGKLYHLPEENGMIQSANGELSERFKEPVLKTGDGETHREFESHTLRQFKEPLLSAMAREVFSFSPFI